MDLQSLSSCEVVGDFETRLRFLHWQIALMKTCGELWRSLFHVKNSHLKPTRSYQKGPSRALTILWLLRKKDVLSNRHWNHLWRSQNNNIKNISDIVFVYSETSLDKDFYYWIENVVLKRNEFGKSNEKLFKIYTCLKMLFLQKRFYLTSFCKT